MTLEPPKLSGPRNHPCPPPPPFMAPMLSPFDIIVVAQIVALLLLLSVVQHHHWSVEVDNLPCGQQVEVGATVTPTVAVPVQSCCQGETCVQLHWINWKKKPFNIGKIMLKKKQKQLSFHKDTPTAASVCVQAAPPCGRGCSSPSYHRGCAW